MESDQVVSDWRRIHHCRNAGKELGVSNKKIPKVGLGYSGKMHHSIACAATEAGSSLTV